MTERAQLIRNNAVNFHKCSTCHATPGQLCMTVTGHTRTLPHQNRVHKAEMQLLTTQRYRRAADGSIYLDDGKPI